MTNTHSIAWADNIPAHWQVKDLMWCCKERKIKNAGNREKNVLSLSYGKIITRDTESNHGLLPDSFDTYQIVETGNIVLRLTDLQNDKRSLRTGLVKQQGIITSAYVALEALDEIYPDFLHYLLYSYDVCKVFYGLGDGVRQSMKFEDLKHLPLILPPLPIQRAIADFLDRKTAAIDALIDKKQKLLDLLAEKRAALINQAVTKGLNPHAPMKDSGIPWIGQIPAHWEVKKLGWILLDGPRNGVSPALANDDEGICSFSLSAIRHGVVEVRDEDIKYVLASQSDVARFNIQKGDLLLVRGNGNINLVGTVGLVQDDSLVNFVYPDLLMRMRCADFLCPAYLCFCINSDVVRPQLNTAARTTVGTFKVNNQQVRELRIIVPPKIEATAIAGALEQRLSSQQKQSKTIETQIERLQEYRQAVITAAVTGQVDVTAQTDKTDKGG